ncbi:hypothetical protein HMPREF0880_03109 [Yokenella regensburgei ATCC 43003]|nr:hypothetical protein HMPREF0880_03109 [Yokenella regensburgei ATCC 43003]
MLQKTNFNDISITHPKIVHDNLCDSTCIHPAVIELSAGCHLKLRF